MIKPCKHKVQSKQRCALKYENLHFSVHVCDGPCRKVWKVMCLHIWHLRLLPGQWTGLSDHKASVECSRISPRFCLCWYHNIGGFGNILRASGSETKMLELSSKIRLDCTNLIPPGLWYLCFHCGLLLLMWEVWIKWLRLLWDCC